jgi:carboxypeptidase Taq
MTARQAYEELVTIHRNIGVLSSVAAVIGWDERTYMPPKGSAHRAEQAALLAKLSHEHATSPRIGDLLAQVEGTDLTRDPDAPEAANIREMRRAYERQVKVPASLVEELARICTLGQNIWQEARKKNDFPAFAPTLEKIVDLKKQEAQAIGFKDSPYDALLNDYEVGATAREIRAVFAELRKDLVPLVAAITAAPRQPRRDILTREFDIDRQHLFGQSAAAAIGFDFTAGRLDTTTHPFCSGMGPGDCRLTTRYSPREFNQGFFGILHEAGHGIYEQGLDPAHFGEPLGTSVSLGIHESQSRLWENQVGRGRPFWEHFFPRAQQMFPGSLDDVSLDDFVFAINRVERSFIRVEADEATYNIHIILRFELEQALIEGDLKPRDVPAAWNEKFKAFFDLTPPDDAHGCLQDIHWSGGGIGYFPTYTLGNLYAAQFMEQIRRDLPNLDEDFRQGRFVRLKTWLNEKIHRPGQRYRPLDLCRRITGAELSPKPLMTYLRCKYGALYGIS